MAVVAVHTELYLIDDSGNQANDYGENVGGHIGKRGAMSLENRRLRDSLELALVNDEHFGQHFYELLFAREPQLKQLFQRNSPGAQSKMFAQKLTALVDHLENPEAFARELMALASSPREYGVTAAMYAPVGEALLDTMRRACGDAFTEELEQAWRGAYRALSDAMQNVSG